MCVDALDSACSALMIIERCAVAYICIITQNAFQGTHVKKMIGVFFVPVSQRSILHKRRRKNYNINNCTHVASSSFLATFTCEFVNTLATIDRRTIYYSIHELYKNWIKQLSWVRILMQIVHLFSCDLIDNAFIIRFVTDSSKGKLLICNFFFFSF